MGPGQRVSEASLREQLVRGGLHPTRWSNGPGAVYATHDHPYRKVLVVAEGNITFTINGGKRVVPMIPPPAGEGASKSARQGAFRATGTEDKLLGPQGEHVGSLARRMGGTSRVAGERQQVVRMKAGDRLTLPPHTAHRALVGPDGVVCLEAHGTMVHG